ncbi:hypothetical protein [Stenotrophomonas sp. ESTM1D_MKCIP4_1]|uniref:hypothetical protein n=1 Tax=Stenotrophomonas sp. ESTM1D_MKCIP4_1 TaxID=2072414 RepID=UPI00131F40B8|nr:hypothetical protein [Stenotrophomonas sp. ESTM1D_MKCIP4_1]
MSLRIVVHLLAAALAAALSAALPAALSLAALGGLPSLLPWKPPRTVTSLPTRSSSSFSRE